ncbi:MAG: thioesterase family protein [Bradyrhizobium sp.]
MIALIWDKSVPPFSGLLNYMGSQREVESIEAELRRTFEQIIPFNRVLGLRIDSLDFKAPRLRFDMRPELVGNPVRQILHGGVISATLDVVGGLAIALASITRKAEETPARHFPDIGTIDLRIDYLRPGRGHYFVATGRVVRLGGRVAVAHMELVNDTDEQIATGSAAYIVG